MLLSPHYNLEHGHHALACWTCDCTGRNQKLQPNPRGGVLPPNPPFLFVATLMSRIIASITASTTATATDTCTATATQLRVFWPSFFGCLSSFAVGEGLEEGVQKEGFEGTIIRFCVSRTGIPDPCDC